MGRIARSEGVTQALKVYLHLHLSFLFVSVFGYELLAMLGIYIKVTNQACQILECLRRLQIKFMCNLLQTKFAKFWNV